MILKFNYFEVVNIVMLSYVYAEAYCYCVFPETGEEVLRTSKQLPDMPMSCKLTGKKYF